MLDKLLAGLPRRYARLGEIKTALLLALATLFSDLDADLKDALTDANILTARGFWLNFWGFFFHVDRFPDETDADYRRRLRRTLVNGSSTRKAIVEAVKPFSTETPILQEFNGNIVTNDDYSSYNYVSQFTKSAFLMQLQYKLPISGRQNFFIGKSYIGKTTFLFDSNQNRYNAQRIEDIVKATKMGGIKILFKTS